MLVDPFLWHVFCYFWNFFNILWWKLTEKVVLASKKWFQTANCVLSTCGRMKYTTPDPFLVFWALEYQALRSPIFRWIDVVSGIQMVTVVWDWPHKKQWLSIFTHLRDWPYKKQWLCKFMQLNVLNLGRYTHCCHFKNTFKLERRVNKGELGGRGGGGTNSLKEEPPAKMTYVQ